MEHRSAIYWDWIRIDKVDRTMKEIRWRSLCLTVPKGPSTSFVFFRLAYDTILGWDLDTYSKTSYALCEPITPLNFPPLHFTPLLFTDSPQHHHSCWAYGWC